MTGTPASPPRSTPSSRPPAPEWSALFVQAPRMNSIMERWIGSCRRELLDRTLIWNQRHLMTVLREYADFYNTPAPHPEPGRAASPAARWHRQSGLFPRLAARPRLRCDSRISPGGIGFRHAQVLSSATARCCPGPVSPNAPGQRHPGTRGRRCSAVGGPGRTQPPCGRDRPRHRESRRVRASGLAAAVLATACRARQHPAHAAAVPAEPLSLARKRAQTEVSSGLAAPGASGSRLRHPEAYCRGPTHPGQAAGRSGASAPPTYPPCECRLPAGFTERDGIGIRVSEHALDACVRGLDHSSREPGAAPARRGGAVPGRMPPR